MLTELFCSLDDFLKSQKLNLVKAICTSNKTRNRSGSLSTSEMMTIFIWFHCSGYKNFKQFYIEYVCRHLRNEFPGLISYSRFIQLMPRLVIPIAMFLKSSFAQCSGISIIDSTSINVCQIEHTRHRSPTNFLINLLAGLVCYQMNPKKPALKMPDNFNPIIIS
jgi:hypothetical protein